MDRQFEDLESFFGVQSGPDSLPFRKRTLATAFETFDGDEAISNEKPASLNLNVSPGNREKQSNANVLLLDWSLKEEMMLSSSVPIPVSVKSSDFSFEQQCSLNLLESPASFPSQSLERDWVGSGQFYAQFPYYIYPANGVLSSLKDDIYNSNDPGWIKPFSLLFFQFENAQVSYFYFLNGTFTLFFLKAKDSAHELRIRLFDGRILASLIDKGFIELNQEQLSPESSNNEMASGVLSELEELEALSPGSTRLHYSGRLFGLQKTQQYNKILNGDEPLRFVSIEDIKRVIFGRDTSMPLISNPIIICPFPFIGGTLRVPQVNLDKPIKTITRDSETGHVLERSTYKLTINNGILMPHFVNQLLSFLLEYLKGDLTVSFVTDENTASLNMGERVGEPACQSILHRVESGKAVKFSYLSRLHCLSM